MGFVAGVGATVWGCAVQLMAAGKYLFVALLIIAGIVASVATRSMARLQWFYCALNVILCLVVIIGLPAATPVEYKNTAEYAFGGFENCLVVSIAFSMGTDIEIIMASPIGQPMAAILFNSFGKKGTLVVWALVVLAQFMGVTSAVSPGSDWQFAW
ncbi:hypothetical protein EW026_g4368 [Hermanssonia centrifuga]|uniref:Uncharacterized protein n=1 Tax=Hermanssonia centrifuga TaxID=98765 RepID=A0A4V3XAD3_9APHY|nr:hypothetical protein EW026_g4368 [Hermanssonia centrifuga]